MRMSGEVVERNRAQTETEIGRLEQEVAILDDQLAKLVLKDSQSPPLLRMLGKAFGFGASGKLEWARFKLKFKQEELSRLKTRYDTWSETAPASAQKREKEKRVR